MRTRSYLQAIHEAQREELLRDPSVILMGQDLHANLYGAAGGFLREFGPERIRDLPLSEAGFVGAAVGAALTGLRPIVDMTVAAFMFVAMDQFVNQVAKSRYMFGGQADVPVVYRAGMFYGQAKAAHHSDRPYPMFMQVPGLKIVMPATPADAKGLLKMAVRCDDPVLCFEEGNLWSSRGPVSDDPDHTVPFGVAEVRRRGTDVSVVAFGAAVREALAAAAALEGEGISVEVVDPRTLVPMDWETIIASVTRTTRLVVVEMANRTCGAAAEVAATVVQEAFWSLAAPIVRVCTPDIPIPFSPALESGLYPDAAKIATAVRTVLEPSGRSRRARQAGE
jgi:pyruvate dehydrogenase E1 component beta subunit